MAAVPSLIPLLKGLTKPVMVRFTALAIILASIAAVAPSVGGSYVNAQSGTFGAISIDMNPAGNTAGSLGARQECREALPGASITLDVTIEGISASTPMISYGYVMEFAGPTLAVTDNEHIKLASGAGSSVFNASDPLPDFDGMWNGAALETRDGPNVHETGSGALERLAIEVSTDAAPAVYKLIITEAIIIDPTSEAHSPAATRNARLAIGVPCAGSTPLPEVTGTPAASGGATQPPGGATRSPGGATNAPGETATPDGTASPTGGGASPGTTDASGTARASRSPSPGPYERPSPTASTVDDEGGGGSGGWIALAVSLVVVAGATGGWFAYRRYRER